MAGDLLDLPDDPIGLEGAKRRLFEGGAEVSPVGQADGEEVTIDVINFAFEVGEVRQ